MLGRIGGYFKFLRPCDLRLGEEVETGSAGFDAGASEVREVVGGGVDVALERVPTVEFALATIGTRKARSRARVDIAKAVVTD
jgi:hypothetical protein